MSNSLHGTDAKVIAEQAEIYKHKGYANRADYLRGLAEENGVDLDIVLVIADMLGPYEDFDGLVSMVEDIAYM